MAFDSESYWRGVSEGKAKMNRRQGQRSALDTNSLFRLRIADLASWLSDQSASFWLVLLYLFFEYVRPQSIYPAVAGWPLAQYSMLAALGALVLEGKLTRPANRADGALVLFGTVVVASMFLAYDPDHAVAEWKLIGNWILIYYLITTVADTEKRFLVLMVTFLLWSLKMAQHATRSWLASGFRFRRWGATGAPGWFHNSGEFAIQMAIFVPLSIYFIIALKKYWPRWKTYLMWLLPASGIIGVLASQSRGGQLGLAAAVGVIALKSQRKVRVLGGLCLVFIAGWFLMPEAQKERFTEVGEDATSRTRLIYWQDGIEIMEEHPVLGIGYRNWTRYYPVYSSNRATGASQDPVSVPHNIFIQAGAELGYSGLFAFLLLIGATLYLNHKTRRLATKCRGDPDFYRYMSHGLDAALVGYLVSGFFVTVLYYPYFWVNLAMTSALYTVARKRAHQDRYVKRGSLPRRDSGDMRLHDRARM